MNRSHLYLAIIAFLSFVVYIKDDQIKYLNAKIAEHYG